MKKLVRFNSFIFTGNPNKTIGFRNQASHHRRNSSYQKHLLKKETKRRIGQRNSKTLQKTERRCCLKGRIS